MARTKKGPAIAAQDIASSPPTRRVRVTRSTSREPTDINKNNQDGDDARNIRKPSRPNGSELPTLEEVSTPALQSGRRAGISRASVMSVASGLTAVTSFSREEASELDPEMMADVLPSLAHASEVLAEMLVHPDSELRPVVWKEIRTAGQRQWKLFNNRVESLLLHKRSFGSMDYIQPSIVLQALFDTASIDHVRTGPWRPDNCFYRINLVEMLRHLITLEPKPMTENVHDALARLDTSFASTIAGPVFDRKAFDLAIKITIQLAIASLWTRGVENDNELSIIAEVFCHEEITHQYKHAEALHVKSASPETQKQCDDEYGQALESVVNPFEENPRGISAAIEDLQNKHPWEKFLEDVVTYFISRDARLNAQISEVGGVSAISDGLAQAVEQLQNDKAAQTLRQKLTQTSPKKKFGAGAIAALKAREKRSSDNRRVVTIQTTSSEPLSLQRNPTTTAPQDEASVEEEEGADDVPTSQARAISSLDELGRFLRLQQGQIGNLQRRAFADRQNNAQRVEWAEDELQPTQDISGPSRSQAKRTHDQMVNDVQDFDPTQDEGFETNDRGFHAANDRRRVISAPPQRSRSQDVARANPSSGSSSHLLESSRAGDERPVRRNPGSSLPPPLGPLPDNEGRDLSASDMYVIASVMSKQRRVVDGPFKSAKTREPFTRDEENAIIDLIEQYGPSWSKIKMMDSEGVHGSHLSRRTAEQIRFKARNMKVNFLLSGVTELPPGFDSVPLDKKAIELLEDRGVTYIRQQIRSRAMDA